ncbi:NAD(P)/FAD-dependent oxidoreductase [Streptococcus sp. DD12]|uniref:NAD(P)/FAD-dependent oxidoreductase n=1 Tax=Streptococcus sp. DD12 TaxID=1777880 RepID=UPI00079B6589|nr:FAD-dependent oxidoreductase [Streptococcus sp. DD12]KXT76294.1 Glycine/D-amino acid oxidases family [Streptococcus sp. DD12]
MTKIAIIGAGAVGATAAFYLSRETDCDLTVFDYGEGQATKAAAGIICPWFSKRRNKAWYRLANKGAHFYQELLKDLAASGYDGDFYQQTGVLLLKKDDKKLDELYDLALSRRDEAPAMGDLSLLEASQVQDLFPGLTGFARALYATGGARVDGARLTQTLLKASGVPLVKGKVDLEVLGDAYRVGHQVFDQVILATGAWLGEILEPLGYSVDVRPQKGQLSDYSMSHQKLDTCPVVMPEGELDLIPFTNGQLSIGASHENDKGFDLTVDPTITERFDQEAMGYYPDLRQAKVHQSRVGTRAYTRDFSPFFGQVPGLSGVYAASGLGSTGLTIGPLIGQFLANLATSKKPSLNPSDYPIGSYIAKR